MIFALGAWCTGWREAHFWHPTATHFYYCSACVLSLPIYWLNRVCSLPVADGCDFIIFCSSSCLLQHEPTNLSWIFKLPISSYIFQSRISLHSRKFSTRKNGVEWRCDVSWQCQTANQFYSPTLQLTLKGNISPAIGIWWLGTFPHEAPSRSSAAGKSFSPRRGGSTKLCSNGCHTFPKVSTRRIGMFKRCSNLYPHVNLYNTLKYLFLAKCIIYCICRLCMEVVGRVLHPQSVVDGPSLS